MSIAEKPFYNDLEISKSISIETVRKIKYHFFRLHDNGVNQKYDKLLPYSFHLASAKEQLFKIRKLMFVKWGVTFENASSSEIGNKFITNNNLFSLLIIAMYCHDSLEDGNITYNDLIKILVDFKLTNVQATFIADIVFCVTDEKGKTRDQRKNKKFYDELFENENAVLVKLADILANVMHTITFNHFSAKGKLEEFKHLISITPIEIYDEYEPVFDYISDILIIQTGLDAKTNSPTWERYKQN